MEVTSITTKNLLFAILVLAGKIQNSIIKLNKFSFFEGLERNLLPPSQSQISPKLTDDATLI